MNDIYVFGYLGSGVNHLRWLILLSDSFTFGECKLLEQKLNFINSEVYNKNRTYQTWIDIERQNKKILRNQKVHVNHNVWTEEEYNSILDEKSIFLDSDPSRCLKHYFMLSSNLNGFINKHFLWSVHLNRVIIKNSLPEMLVINPNFLDHRDLLLSTIRTIEEYLDISINYDAANHVHNLWYDLKNKAESDFLNDVSVLYKERIK